jgi:hypothetical protein
MLFGFETISIDSPDYGKFFFQEWNKNKSLSQAWLDASWRISAGQAPSVVACGATQQEAVDRLYNERYFYRDAVSSNWWAWRWYYAARGRERSVRLPEVVHSALLVPQSGTELGLSALADRFGITVPRGALRQAPVGGMSFEDPSSGRAVAVSPDGTWEVRLGEADPAAPQLATEDAVRAAEAAVASFGLAADIDLVFDQVRHDYHASGTTGEQTEPRVRSTTVHFRQVIDNLPVVTPGAGEVLVHVDNSGTVTGVSDSTHRVSDLRPAPAGPASPGDREPSGPAAGASSAAELLDAPLQRRLRFIAGSGYVPTSVREVPGSTEVGFAIRGAEAVLVARREVELDMGQGLAKRYALEVPIRG